MTRGRRCAGAAALALVLPFAAAPAAAAEWWYVADSADSVTFVDRASAVPTRAAGRNSVRVWFASFDSVAGRDGVKSRKVQSFVDCQDRSMATRSYIGYAPDGSVKAQDSISEYMMEWQPVAPGTVGEAQLVFACNARQLTPKPPRISPNSAGKRG